MLLFSVVAWAFFAHIVSSASKEDEAMIATLVARGVDVAKLTTWLNAFTEGCTFACQGLSLFYDQRDTAFPGSSQYTNTTTSYFAIEQASLRPTCVFLPSVPDEVAVAILVARLTKCEFAVKSGGHAPFEASNINNGITIDLAALNQVTVSADKTVTSVGSGNRWANVYSQLEEQNLTVIGGRVGDVGVGGLLLGGGVSYLSGAHGWGCDNIVNYEIVIANGSVINANLTSNPDLYRALRGGGNNLGVVTRFDAITYPQGLMLGVTRAHTADKQAALLHAFVDFTLNSLSDPLGSIELSFAVLDGQLAAAADMRYASPVSAPSILSEFRAIPATVERVSIAPQSTLTELTQAALPFGEHVLDFTATFVLDEPLLNLLVDIFAQETNSTWTLPGANLGIQFHPLNTNTLSLMSRNGGNILGLDASRGPLFFIHLAGLWSDASQSQAITTALANCHKRIVREAGAAGLLLEYEYMNYANKGQDPVRGYGERNRDFLKKTAKKFDEDQVFQKLVPGYFKL